MTPEGHPRCAPPLDRWKPLRAMAAGRGVAEVEEFQLFSSELAREMSAIGRAVESRAPEQVRRGVHQLLGRLGFLRATHATPFAAALSSAAANADWPEAEAHWQSLRDTVAPLQRELSALCSAARDASPRG